MSSNKSTTKTEQRAITKLRDAFDKIETIKTNFNENDKGISFDGSIELYNGNIDKKENYNGEIKVQIKGRTINQRLNRKKSCQLDVDKNDINNYEKVDGIIFFVVLFESKNPDSYGIYSSSLLPAKLKKIKDENKTNMKPKLKIKFDKINDSDDLEEICRNFKIQQNIQKGNVKNISNNFYDVANDKIEFKIWQNKNKNEFSLVGTEQYFYEYDKSNKLVNILLAKINSITTKTECKISNEEKTIVYDYIDLVKTNNSKTIRFGKSFCIYPETNKIKIEIKGTFKERLKDLSFLSSIYDNSGFFIDNSFTSIELDKNNKEKIKEYYTDYLKLDAFIKKHGIEKDYDFDNWSQKDFEKLSFVVNLIESGKVYEKNIFGRPVLGSYTINDFCISIFSPTNSDIRYYCETTTIWNSKRKNYKFKITSGDEKIYTNNIFMSLNKEAYYSDDINYNEMKESLKNYTYDKNERTLINNQVLKILLAYDDKKNQELLDYALWLTNKLLENSKDKNEKNIYRVNYYQIIKRQRMLTENEEDELVDIKENSENEFIKIGCNILLNDTHDINFVLRKFDTDTLNILKTYPIFNLKNNC